MCIGMATVRGILSWPEPVKKCDMRAKTAQSAAAHLFGERT